MEYDISIRISFPEDISAILKREKDRFVAEYGSKYKSEPHITLYRSRYTQEGFAELIQNLKKRSLKKFEISLLGPKVIIEQDRHRNLYIMDVSNKEQVEELRTQIYTIAVQYSGKEDSKRGKELEPHITLGEIDFHDPRANLADVQNNLKEIEGAKIVVSDLTVVFVGRADGDESFKLIEKVVIPF